MLRACFTRTHCPPLSTSPRPTPPPPRRPELVVLIAVASDKKKETGSTDGMQRSVATSPLLAHRAKEGVPGRLAAIQVRRGGGGWVAGLRVGRGVGGGRAAAGRRGIVLGERGQ